MLHLATKALLLILHLNAHSPCLSLGPASGSVSRRRLSPGVYLPESPGVCCCSLPSLSPFLCFSDASARLPGHSSLESPSHSPAAFSVSCSEPRRSCFTELACPHLPVYRSLTRPRAAPCLHLPAPRPEPIPWLPPQSIVDHQSKEGRPHRHRRRFHLKLQVRL